MTKTVTVNFVQSCDPQSQAATQTVSQSQILPVGSSCMVLTTPLEVPAVSGEGALSQLQSISVAYHSLVNHIQDDYGGGELPD